MGTPQNKYMVYGIIMVYGIYIYMENKYYGIWYVVLYIYTIYYGNLLYGIWYMVYNTIESGGIIL